MAVYISVEVGSICWLLKTRVNAFLIIILVIQLTWLNAAITDDAT